MGGSMAEKVVITGGAGFIGSHMAELLLKEGYQVTIIDNLTSGRLDTIKHIDGAIDFINADIRDLEALTLAMQNAKKVFHFAAEISVPKSMQEPHLTEEVNTQGTINVLEAMRINNVPLIVFASSAAVYGNSDICPKTTAMLPAPISPYAISKLAGEHYLSMFQAHYGITSIVTRFFNVFGERQSIQGGYAAAVPIFIQKAINNQTITIYGDGEQTRDFIYVKDLVHYLYLLAKANKSDVFNLGYGKSTTINNLARTIIENIKSKSTIVYEEERAGDIKHSFAQVDVINMMSYSPIGLNAGIQETINYYKANVSF